MLAHREQGVPLKEQAVLFRAAHHSDHLEVELTRRNIPFVKYGGLKFMEAAHVKDALAILRVLENPHDEVAWFRVLQLPEGMGPATARRLMQAIGVRTSDDGSPLLRFLDEPVDVPRAALEGIQELRSALRGCADETVLSPAGQIERLRTFLAPVFARRYDAAAARLRDLEQLAALAAGYEARGRFLAELTLDPPSSTGDLAGPPLLDEDWLVLSTIHSAKGLEWRVVHVIHAADGMIPSDMATGDDDEIEEERRLLYVALTRARDALHVYRPMRYYRKPKGDPHSFSQLSRFLEPASVRSTFAEHRPTGRRATRCRRSAWHGRRRRLPRRSLVGVAGRRHPLRRRLGSLNGCDTTRCCSISTTRSCGATGIPGRVASPTASGSRTRRSGGRSPRRARLAAWARRPTPSRTSWRCSRRPTSIRHPASSPSCSRWSARWPTRYGSTTIPSRSCERCEPAACRPPSSATVRTTRGRSSTASGSSGSSTRWCCRSRSGR